jgi:hypothetical protein
MASEPTINPYAPPTADVDPPVTVAGTGAFARPLFSPPQIGVATFLGSLLSGVLLLQANYRAMGKSAAANKALGFGIAASALFIALQAVVPARGLSTAINIGLAIGMHRFVLALQGDEFAAHRAAGGARRSSWWVAGVVLTMVVALVLGMMLIYAALGVRGAK